MSADTYNRNPLVCPECGADRFRGDCATCITMRSIRIQARGFDLLAEAIGLPRLGDKVPLRLVKRDDDLPPMARIRGGEMSEKNPGFYITGKKGFHITFANGWTVSVQFGPANYCSHYDRRIGQDEEACGKEGSCDAEVAFWGPDGEMQEVDGDTVQGRQSPAQVLARLNDAASR